MFQTQKLLKNPSLFEKNRFEIMITTIVGIFWIFHSLDVLNYWIFRDASLVMIVDVLLVVNSSVNSIMYGIFSKQYRNMLKSSLNQACGAPKESTTPDFASKNVSKGLSRTTPA